MSAWGDMLDEKKDEIADLKKKLEEVTAECDELLLRLAEAPVAKAWLDSDGAIASVQFIQRGGHPFVNPKSVRVRIVRDDQGESPKPQEQTLHG